MGADIFTNFWCFVHNFGYRYARKSFKGSKDADIGLASEKILSHNNGPIGWGPGQGKCSQTVATPTCGVPHRKRKNVFFDIDYKTCWIRRGFEQLSSSIAWRVIGLQSSAWNVVFAGLKGLNENRLCFRLKSEQVFRKKGKKNARFMDNAFRNKGTNFFNVGTWRLFAPPIKISGYAPGFTPLF